MISKEGGDYVPYGCIGIKKTNANIWDEQWELGYYDTSGNPQSSTSYIRSKNPININSSLIYYIKVPTDITMYICQYKADGTFIQRNSFSNQTFTPNSECAYIKFNLTSTYGTTYNNNVCINVSNISINGTYIPHQEKTYYFPFTNQKLMQDGTIENKVINEWGEYVFTGQENFTRDYELTNSYRFYTPSNTIPSSISNVSVCNYFQNATSTQINNTDIQALTVINKNQLVLRINKSIASTTQELKTWLANKYTSGDLVRVQYHMDTPSSTDFTPEQQAVIDEIKNDGTYLPVTHYSTNALVNPDINMSYYRDLPTIINNLENT